MMTAMVIATCVLTVLLAVAVRRFVWLGRSGVPARQALQPASADDGSARRAHRSAPVPADEVPERAEPAGELPAGKEPDREAPEGGMPAGEVREGGVPGKPESIEGVLVRQLRAGVIDGGQYRRAMELIARRDAEPHPLAVPSGE